MQRRRLSDHARYFHSFQPLDLRDGFLLSGRGWPEATTFFQEHAKVRFICATSNKDDLARDVDQVSVEVVGFSGALKFWFAQNEFALRLVIETAAEPCRSFEILVPVDGVDLAEIYCPSPKNVALAPSFGKRISLRGVTPNGDFLRVSFASRDFLPIKRIVGSVFGSALDLCLQDSDDEE